jgi:hypothetical protein
MEEQPMRRDVGGKGLTLVLVVVGWMEKSGQCVEISEEKRAKA